MLQSCAVTAPYSDDPEIIEKRQKIDFSQKISVEEAINGSIDIGRLIRVLATGVYDMFHYGHTNQLKQIKEILPKCYLIVGVPTDEETNIYKGKVVQTMVERADMIRHCRYVDEVCKATPYVETIEFLDSMKIDFVAHDAAPYNVANVADIYNEHKKAGRFLKTTRTDGISTTDAICRILKDYEIFVMKNLRRGCTVEELNVGFFLSNKIKAQQTIDCFKKRGRKFITDFKLNFENIWNKQCRSSRND